MTTKHEINYTTDKIKQAETEYRNAIDKTSAWMNGTTFSGARLARIASELEDAEKNIAEARAYLGKIILVAKDQQSTSFERAIAIGRASIALVCCNTVLMKIDEANRI